MSLKIDLKKFLVKEIIQSQPLMDINRVKEQLLTWLAEVKFPAYPDATSWEDCIQVFPPDPQEKNLQSGRFIRIALRLYTEVNQYLISLGENLSADSRGVFTIAVHVNWQAKEHKVQKLVEETYTGHFNDSLRPKHTIWAQTVRMDEIYEALDSCAKAILGNELVGRKETKIKKTPVNILQPPQVIFPEK